MLHIDGLALVLSLAPHGEHGAVVRFLTPDQGLVAGYVIGGRSRALRGTLQPGNLVSLVLRPRAGGGMGQAKVELHSARAALAGSGLGLAALDWATTVTAATLAEGDSHPDLYAGLDAMTAAIAADAPPRLLGETMVRYELLLLARLGLGLDLSSCAATGARDELAYVSPRSRQAVSLGAGLPHAAKLLPLPAFVLGNGAPTAADVAGGLRLSGFFLARDLLGPRAQRLVPTRQRFIDRLAALDPVLFPG
ncbi:DNA repair protein RecO [Sandarakinorhabdus sp.]|uniref:DNA repair protein RecO n=1 Tax=Sandarakinorhabdus sp. TaxID=1916663 RepID=UPI00286E0249|nr:DNA repair protein RecO [Sandarakinorhabdus sp.]